MHWSCCWVKTKMSTISKQWTKIDQKFLETNRKNKDFLSTKNCLIYKTFNFRYSYCIFVLFELKRYSKIIKTLTNNWKFCNFVFTSLHLFLQRNYQNKVSFNHESKKRVSTIFPIRFLLLVQCVDKAPPSVTMENLP